MERESERDQLYYPHPRPSQEEIELKKFILPELNDLRKINNDLYYISAIFK